MTIDRNIVVLSARPFQSVAVRCCCSSLFRRRAAIRCRRPEVYRCNAAVRAYHQLEEPTFVCRRAASPLSDSMTSTLTSAECILPPVAAAAAADDGAEDGKWQKP